MMINRKSLYVAPLLKTSKMSQHDASTIVIDDSRVTLQIVASLTDECIGVIYNCLCL
jgi:hypothetical protein